MNKKNGPFAQAWRTYFDAGWAPIPIRPDSKTPIISDCLGHTGVDLTEEELERYAEKYGDCNIAIRMPETVIGIDLDTYKEEGRLKLEELELMCGPLPVDGPRSSARLRECPTSGIRFFGVNQHHANFKNSLGPKSGIELILRHARYAMVYPSVNYKTGTRYEWSGTGGFDVCPTREEAESHKLPGIWVPIFWKSPKPKPTTESPNVEITPKIKDWGLNRVRDIAVELSRTAAGDRNQAANKAAYHVGALVARGVITEDVAEQILGKASESFYDAKGIGHWPYGKPEEFSRVYGLGFAEGLKNPLEPWPPDIPLGEDDFWKSRPEIAHIKQFAEARMCNPMAVLLVTITRVVATTEPFNVLPSLKGGAGSLNSFLAIVAHSSGGKSSSIRASRDAVRISDEPETVKPGSGEGLSSAYVRWVPPHGTGDNRQEGFVEQYNYRLLMYAPEVTAIGALKLRSGATLLPELVAGWSGEALGFQYRSDERRLPVREQNYRLCLIVGVQPDLADVILEEKSSGLPQRFIWCSAEVSELPDEEPEEPEFTEWEVPPVPSLTWGGVERRRPIITLSPKVRREIIRVLRANTEGKVSESLSGHRIFAREKLAAGFALLNGRWDINDDDWALSAYVMRESDRVLRGLMERKAEVSRKENEGKGRARAIQESIVHETLDQIEIRRIKERVLALLNDGVELSKRDIRMKLSTKQQERFEEVFDALVADGLVSVVEISTGRRPSTRVRKII